MGNTKMIMPFTQVKYFLDPNGNGRCNIASKLRGVYPHGAEILKRT
jgi:hypothetical protein